MNIRTNGLWQYNTSDNTISSLYHIESICHNLYMFMDSDFEGILHLDLPVLGRRKPALSF